MEKKVTDYFNINSNNPFSKISIVSDVKNANENIYHHDIRLGFPTLVLYCKIKGCKKHQIYAWLLNVLQSSQSMENT